MRTMYDSVNPSNIPAGAQMVAGYANGPQSQWPASGWDRFPSAVKIRIDVTGADPYGSDVIDVETGDATIAGAVEWVKARQARGWWSAAYVDQANYDALVQAMGNLDCEYWVAHWGLPEGVAAEMLAGRIVAVQYLNDTASGYDVSVVNDLWFPSPTAPAPPKPAPSLTSVLVTAHYSDGSAKTVTF